MIFNRGKPRHARPRRPWATMLATLLTTIALVFVPGTALADSGMDVSKWQGCVGSSQAATAKASGVNFAFVKVTEGNGYTDSVADCTMQSLKANGIRRGVYHLLGLISATALRPRLTGLSAKRAAMSTMV